MKIVRVIYTAKAEYAEQNSANIRTVMNDLQALNKEGVRYFATLSPDGKTFTHTAMFQSVEDEKVLLSLPSFIRFQEQLKASGPESPPMPEEMQLVGASFPLFA